MCARCLYTQARNHRGDEYQVLYNVKCGEQQLEGTPHTWQPCKCKRGARAVAWVGVWHAPLGIFAIPCVLSKQGCCFFALIRTRTHTRALSQRCNTCSALPHDKPCRWAQSAIHGQCLSPPSTTFHRRIQYVVAIQHGAYSCGPGGGGAARRRGGSDGAGDAGGACCCCCCCCCMPKTGF